jgi:tetratricopeptide (TPR) repeat protein
LLVVLLGIIMGLPVSAPPMGAIRPLWNKAADLRALKSYSAAVETYEQIARLNVQDPKPLLAAGEIYLVQHRWPLAEDAFNRALARDGNNPSALAGLGAARWGQGDTLRAASLWQAALDACSAEGSNTQQQPVESEIRLRLAVAYLDMQRLDDAQALLRQELTHSDSAVAHLYLAMILATEDTDQARRHLQAIHDGEPSWIADVRAYLVAALDQADSAGSKAEAAKSLGLAFVQVKEWQLAHTALQQALRLDPSDVEAMAFLGHVEAQLGQPAFDHLAAAVAARADWPMGHYLLGLYYLQQGTYEFAAEEFRVTLRLDPGNAQAQADLAKAYASLGDYPAAEDALAKAVQSAPQNLAFHLALIRFYADHAYAIDRGLAAAQAAEDLAPDNAQVHDTLGWMYFLAGDPNQARAQLESALQLDPTLASAHYHMGVLHKALGEEKDARLAFSHAVDLDTDGYYRDQAQAAMREMGNASQLHSPP